MCQMPDINYCHVEKSVESGCGTSWNSRKAMADTRVTITAFFIILSVKTGGYYETQQLLRHRESRCTTETVCNTMYFRTDYFPTLQHCRSNLCRQWGWVLRKCRNGQGVFPWNQRRGQRIKRKIAGKAKKIGWWKFPFDKIQKCKYNNIVEWQKA